MSKLQTSPEGLAFVRKHEGCSLKTYRCTAGVLTIGVGHTGPDVTEGKIITQEEANRLLAQDIRWAEGAVNHGVKVALKQHQFDALVSFTFNVGASAFLTSTLLKRLNAGDYDGAAKEFVRWTKQKELMGRRLAETKLFKGE